MATTRVLSLLFCLAGALLPLSAVAFSEESLLFNPPFARALFFDDANATLSLEGLRKICPGATGDLAVTSGYGERPTILHMSSVPVPRGLALFFVFDLIHGIDCGTTYEFAQIGGISSALPAEFPMQPISPAVALRLQQLCTPSAPFPLLRYFVQVSHPVTDTSIEVPSLVDSGVSMSVFVGADSALNVASAGGVEIGTIAGVRSFPWGIFTARLAGRAVEGPTSSHHQEKRAPRGAMLTSHTSYRQELPRASPAPAFALWWTALHL